MYIVHQRKLQTVQHRNSSHKPRVHFTRLGESEQTKEDIVYLRVLLCFVYMCLCAFVSDICDVSIIIFKK